MIKLINKINHYSFLDNFFLGTILIVIQTCYAQNITAPTVHMINNNIPSIASPEVSNLLRFQDFPDINFIGGTDINIPLYEIKIDELKIPITLSYNTKGAKVSDIASNVGLGWNLNAGGTVTLDVNDMYDFSANFTRHPQSSWSISGCGLFGIDYKVPASYGPRWEGTNIIFDSAPDFYNVNAPGLNDKFYLSKENGLFQLKSLQNYKTKLLTDLTEAVDFDIYDQFYLGSFSPIPSANYPEGNGSMNYIIKNFNIQNDNGFLYKFTERMDSKSTTSPVLSYPPIKVNNRFPYTWLLTSIQSPSSFDKKINFIYEKFNNQYLENNLSILTNINTGSIETYPYIYDAIQGYKVLSSNINAEAFKYKINTTEKLNSQRLRQIDFPEGIVLFEYGNQRSDYDGQVLSKIVIKTKSGNVIKVLEFNYSYFQSIDTSCTDGYNCLRLKLDNIYDSSLQSSYYFTYGGQSPSDNLFPPRGSGKVDFLGYYNENSTNLNFNMKKDNLFGNGITWTNLPTPKIYFYPSLEKDNFLPFKLVNYAEESITGNIDATSNSKSLLGLLTRIQYPTKGGLKIVYENDDFEYLGNNYLLGSSRIKNMEYFDTSGLSVRKVNFTYKNNNQLSSGQISFLIPPSHIVRGVVNSGYKNSAIVGYSKITQEEVGKGKTERYYSNFDSFPDIYETISPISASETNLPNYIPPTLTGADANFFKYFKFPGKYIQNMDLRRGKLLEEIYYNAQNNILKKSINEYEYYIKSTLSTNKKLWRYTITDGPGDDWTNYSAKNTLINYQNYLARQNVEEYFNNGSLKSQTLYTYDLSNNLLKTKEQLSSGNSDMLIYKYAIDLNQTGLINANMLSTLLVEEQKRNNKTIETKEIVYSNTSSNILPTSVLSKNIQNGIVSTEIKYDQYDDHGNLIQYTNKNGIPTVILWGYNSTLPIAKIEGKGAPALLQFHAENEELLNLSNNDVDATSEELFQKKLDELQSNQSFYDVSITTYTHDPLVGITSITPPSGIREVYIYDTANRLKEIRQDSVSGKLLKTFKYNYKN